MYVYDQKGPKEFEVGYWRADGLWVVESEHATDRSACGRVSWLNGGEEPKSRTVKPDNGDTH